MIKKLGWQFGQAMLLRHAPPGYLNCLPRHDVETFDWAQAFYTSQSELEREFPDLKRRLKSNGQLWISWPKRASKVPTDLNDNVVRSVGLANGLVDVKVAAVDEVWSAIKFVYRLADRPANAILKT